jgi:hypothetical protein
VALGHNVKETETGLGYGALGTPGGVDNGAEMVNIVRMMESRNGRIIKTRREGSLEC